MSGLGFLSDLPCIAFPSFVFSLKTLRGFNMNYLKWICLTLAISICQSANRKGTLFHKLVISNTSWVSLANTEDMYK